MSIGEALSAGASDSPSLPASIRAATVADVDQIHALIEEASRTTTVLPRSRDSICHHLRDFVVAESEGRVQACAMLYLFTVELAEIKSLVVAPALRGRGVGTALVQALVGEARRIEVRRVFALTDNPGYFGRLGFVKTPKENFPHKVWRECIHCPKFLDCREDAVELILEQDESPAAKRA